MQKGRLRDGRSARVGGNRIVFVTLCRVAMQPWRFVQLDPDAVELIILYGEPTQLTFGRYDRI